LADYKKIENKRKQDWIIKSDIDLKKTIDILRRERYIKGLDEKPASYNEMIKAAFRFEPTVDILKKAEFKREKEK
jgi:hypothetical protein